MPWEPLGGTSPEPQPVGDGLARVLRGFGAPAPQALGSLFGEWESLVGERLAAHSRPLKLRGTVLVVGVDDAGWATQVRWMSQDLLARLADGLGAGVVTSVEVRVEPRRS